MVSEQSRGSTGPAPDGELDDSGSEITAQTRPIPEADQLMEFGPASREAPKVKPGNSLGRYVILRQLAAGGMSVVYVAYDPELNRQVALKVMRPGGPEGDVAASERLLREAQAMARLSHVNVVHVYDVGVVDQRVYMAMEYVRGETLEEWLGSAVRSWREIIRVLVRAGRGLAAAHAAGLVHLDFKPRNVLVGDDGEIRVVDFGLARPPRSMDSAGGELQPKEADSEVLRDLMTTSGRFIEPITQYGLVMGTPGYMAAEQLAGEGADARSDQFAFCVTAWVALYDGRPFAGSTTRELNHAVMIGKLDTPQDVRNVPIRIRRLLERGLNNDPDARHPALDELLDQLQAGQTHPLRKGVLALGVLSLVGAAGYGFARTGSEGVKCEGGQELLDGAWDAETRAAVDAAIRSDSRRFAADVAVAVTRSLDRWTADWTQMHRDSCQATHVRGEQSTELLDLRTRCLRRHLSELRALTSTLLDADATTVEHATEAVARLAPVDECGNRQGLETTMRPPPADQEAQVEATFDRMAQALAKQGAGKYAEALVLALEGLLTSELLEYGPLQVFARHVTAGLLMEFGDAAAAEAMFLEAIYAAERSGLDAKRLTMAVELTFVLGIRQGKPDRAHRMARMAAALAERLDAGPEQRARLLSNEGAVYGSEGRPHESIERYLAALKIQEELPDGDQANLASIHLGLGASYHLMASYEEGLKHFERARELLSREYGEYHPRTAAAHENIGTAYQGMGRFEDAKRTFTKARKIYEDALVSDLQLASLFNSLAAAHEGLEEYDEAITYFERVVDTLGRAGNETATMAVAMGNLALVYVEIGRYEDALTAFATQLPLMKRAVGDAHIYSHYFRLGKARALLGRERYAEAVTVAGSVVAVYEQRKSEIDPLHQGEAALVLARALHALAQAGEPPPEDVLDVVWGQSIDAWAAAARVHLETAGTKSNRAMRRLEAFEAQRKKSPR